MSSLITNARSLAFTVLLALWPALAVCADIESLPVYVFRPNGAVASAASYLSNQSAAQGKAALKFGTPLNDVLGFCDLLRVKDPYDAIYIAPLSSFSGCDSRVTALSALDFPFIAKDWIEARALLNGPMGFAVAGELQKQRMDVLGFWNGDTSVISARKPILTAKDLKGQKIFAHFSYSSRSAIEGAGATRSTLPGAEIVPAMERGLLDAAETPLALYSAQQLYTVNKYVLLSNHYIDPVVVSIPSATLAKLTPTQRAFLEEVVRDSTLVQIDESQKLDAANLSRLKEKGVSIAPYSVAMARSFKTPAMTDASLSRASQVFASTSTGISEPAKAQIRGAQIDRYWKVRFATNRVRKGDAFSNDIATNLMYGSVDVRFDWEGPVNGPGEYQDPHVADSLTFRSRDADFVIDWKNVTTKPFPASLIAAPHSVPAKAPVVYVHGFANTFQDAARRAAWIGWNAKRPSIAFLWPSKGSTVSYDSDKKVAAASWGALAELLSNLGREYDEQSDLDIVVHSMGAYVLLGALQELGSRAQPGKSIRFRQVVLVAPDVPSAELRKTWQSVTKYFERAATLYVSDHDLALGISRSVINRQAGDRAGLAPPVFILDKIESIFIGPNDFSFKGHSYHSANGVIADDILELLRYGTGADERRGCGRAGSHNDYFVLRRLTNP